MSTSEDTPFDHEYVSSMIVELALSLEHGNADSAARYLKELKGVLADVEQRIRVLRRRGKERGPAGGAGPRTDRTGGDDL
jgi:hypothetical protein